MADRSPNSRNAAPPNPLIKFVPVVIIVIALAVFAFVFFGPHGGNAPAPTASPAAAPAGSAAQPGAATPAPAPVPELTKEQLVKEAGTAFHELRYVAPPGNNALEYYLRILDKEPNNQIAKDALREMFPMVIGPVEQDINAGNLDEATRVIDLLAKFDANNYTLTILRSKLDAKKKQADKEQQAAAAAAAAAAAKNAANTAQNAAAAAPAATAQAPAPATAAPVEPPKPAQAPPPAAPAVAATAEPAAPVGETHPAELVKGAQPEYPIEAYKQRKGGWVEVQFTVTAGGQVADAKVLNAEPARLFNDAAVRAVSRSTFKPRMENGKAVDQQMIRRIEFKLSG